MTEQMQQLWYIASAIASPLTQIFELSTSQPVTISRTSYRLLHHHLCRLLQTTCSVAFLSDIYTTVSADLHFVASSLNSDLTPICASQEPFVQHRCQDQPPEIGLASEVWHFFELGPRAFDLSYSLSP